MVFPYFDLAFALYYGAEFYGLDSDCFYRDVRHFVEISLMLLFWLTPVIYDVARVPESLRSVIYLNPPSFFILSYQDIIYRQVVPEYSRWVILILLTLASLWIGYRVNSTYKARFAEEV